MMRRLLSSTVRSFSVQVPSSASRPRGGGRHHVRGGSSHSMSCRTAMCIHARRAASRTATGDAPSPGGRAEAERVLARYKAELDGMGHWSMRQKTEVLERMARAVCGGDGVDGAAAHNHRATFVGALWLAGNAGQTRIAGEVFEEMRARGLVLRGDPSPFDALLKAETVAAEPDAGRVTRVWADMRAHGVCPGQRSYELLCLALERGGESAAAAAVRREAEHEGITFEHVDAATARRVLRRRSPESRDADNTRESPSTGLPDGADADVDVDLNADAAATPSWACLEVLAHAARSGDVATAETAMRDLEVTHRTPPTAHHYTQLLRVYAGSPRVAWPGGGAAERAPQDPTEGCAHSTGGGGRRAPQQASARAGERARDLEDPSHCDRAGDGGARAACARGLAIMNDERYAHPSPGGPDPQGILGVWARGVAAGYAPNEWWYDHVLRAARGRSDLVPLAEALFWRAEALGLAGEQHLWARLMDVYAHAGCDDAAQELLRAMWERGHAVKRASRVMRAFTEATSGWLRV